MACPFRQTSGSYLRQLRVIAVVRGLHPLPTILTASMTLMPLGTSTSWPSMLIVINPLCRFRYLNQCRLLTGSGLPCGGRLVRELFQQARLEFRDELNRRATSQSTNRATAFGRNVVRKLCVFTGIYPLSLVSALQNLRDRWSAATFERVVVDVGVNDIGVVVHSGLLLLRREPTAARLSKSIGISSIPQSNSVPSLGFPDETTHRHEDL